MRRISILTVLSLMMAWLLSDCHNGKPLSGSSLAVDTLKSKLEGFNGSQYQKEEIYAQKGLNIAADSSDYYYFMTFLASARMWANDIHAMNKMQNRILHFVNTSKPSMKTNDIMARYYLLKGNFAILNHDRYASVRNYRKAIEYQKNGLRKVNIAIMLTNLADGYLENSDYAKGAACLRRALFLADSLNLQDAKIQSTCGLAMIYLGLRNFSESDKYFRMAEKLLPKMRGRQKFFFFNSRGNYYYYKGEYDKSLQVFKTMNEQRNEIISTEYDKNLMWINLADAYIKNGMIDSAQTYQKKCRGFFVKSKNNSALYYLETQDIAILLQQNRLDQVNKILKETKLNSDESDMVALRNKYLLDYYTRVGDDRHAFIYLKRLTHLNDSIRNEIQRLATAETAFRYQQDSKALKLELNLSKSQEHLRTSELFLVIAVLIIIILAALFFAAVTYNRHKRAKMAKEGKARVLKLRMEELRNRVSPHFIFNVLNYELYNRQQGITTTDIPILVKLIRNGLDVSDELCVPLTKELDFVDGYVELQRKGLGDNFVYDMRIADDVDLDNVKLPSMMVQIAVENAIKHGLRGLDRDKSLEVEVMREEDATKITITDNGRGLEAHYEVYGTGTGTKVINETLEMLNARNNKKMSYYSKKNPHGIGCRVEIIIPNEYNYSLE